MEKLMRAQIQKFMHNITLQMLSYVDQCLLFYKFPFKSGEEKCLINEPKETFYQ